MAVQGLIACRVQGVVEETPEVRTYRLMAEGEPLVFECGQFVVIELSDGRSAALTISSSPLDRGGFDLTVKRIGEFGTAFYDEVTVGTELAVGRPAGRPVPMADAFCVIGRDYSIPTARSLARWLHDRGDRRPLYVLHEISDRAHALYHEELVSMRVSPCLLGGRLTLEDVRRVVPSPASTSFFVAGEGQDVRAWRAVLAPLELPPSQLVLEKWS